MLPPHTRDLYHALKGSRGFARLGSIADVGIGYVSGANDFFHPSAELVERFAIPSKYLRRAVRRGRALKGLRFTVADWQDAKLRQDASLLLHLRSAERELPSGLRRYLDLGKAARVDQRYKCRMRAPWYAVPHVHTGDALLTYMSGVRPSFCANEAQAVATNTLHVVTLMPGAPSAERLAFAWLSSLTSLSVEIEGHTLGGGMLKLEPTEAERVLLPIGLAPMNLEELEANQEFVDECLLKTAGFHLPNAAC
ncbi:MAG: hypothetical protein H0U43_07510 [Chthoniobacterales bacterium]|nr:hypothetical protein [Chthoniobacterales bacterium]